MLLNGVGKRVAFGGIFVALSLLLLIIASVFPFCRLVFVFCASAIVGLSVINYDIKFSFVQYLACAVLAVLFVPNKSIAMLYALVVGNYPIVKMYLDRIKYKLLCYILKLVIFNLYMVLSYSVATTVLKIDFDIVYPLGLLWVAMLIAFYVYDYIYSVFMHRTMLYVLKK